MPAELSADRYDRRCGAALNVDRPDQIDGAAITSHATEGAFGYAIGRGTSQSATRQIQSENLQVLD